MADVSAQEEQQIREIMEEVEANPGMAADSITAAGTKEAFCDSWPTVKDVLGFLQEFAPPGIRQAIGLVIRAGDKVFERICPA